MSGLCLAISRAKTVTAAGFDYGWPFPVKFGNRRLLFRIDEASVWGHFLLLENLFFHGFKFIAR